MRSFHITFVKDGKVYSSVLTPEQFAEALSDKGKALTEQTVGHYPNTEERLEAWVIRADKKQGGLG